MCVSQDDGGGKMSPSYGMVLRALQNSIIKDNTWQKGVTKAFLVDHGGNEPAVIIKDNLGCVCPPAQGEA